MDVRSGFSISPIPGAIADRFCSPTTVTRRQRSALDTVRSLEGKFIRILRLRDFGEEATLLQIFIQRTSARVYGRRFGRRRCAHARSVLRFATSCPPLMSRPQRIGSSESSVVVVLHSVGIVYSRLSFKIPRVDILKSFLASYLPTLRESLISKLASCRTRRGSRHRYRGGISGASCTKNSRLRARFPRKRLQASAPRQNDHSTLE